MWCESPEVSGLDRAMFENAVADVNIDAAAMPGSFAECGRGLAMAKPAVDVLTSERHNEANCWTLSRTRTVQ